MHFIRKWTALGAALAALSLCLAEASASGPAPAAGNTNTDAPDSGISVLQKKDVLAGYDMFYTAETATLENAGGESVGQLPEGTRLIVSGPEQDGRFPVELNGQVCYIEASEVSETPAVSRYAASTVNLRSTPSEESGSVVTSVRTGTELQIYGEAVDGWYRTVWAGETAYVSAGYISEEKPDPGAEIAAYALQFVGCDYAYGGCGPDVFDCSGLTKYVYAQFGITLPHNAETQADCGEYVSREDLRPGDLVFFYSPIGHVGIYIGNGQYVHASDYGIGVIVSSLDSSSYTYSCHIDVG